MKFLLLLAFLFPFGQTLPPAEVEPVQIEISVWPTGGTLEVKLLNGQKWPSEVSQTGITEYPEWVGQLFGRQAKRMVIVTNNKNTNLAVTNRGGGSIDLSKAEQEVLSNLPKLFPQGIKVARRQNCRWGKSGALRPICR